ncbi:DUF4352 domain-containing protein [Paenibacillaceae bacterium]|nr:DUF4352 domain-containing protein [Paenibacillaceae bacterium]
MKKWLMVISVMLIVFMTACSSSTNTPTDASGTKSANGGKAESNETEQPSEKENDAGKASDDQANAKDENAEKAAAEEPESDPEPEKTPTSQIGDMINVGDWEVTLESFEFKEELSESIMTFSPDEGNVYGVATIKVKNNGGQANTFLPVISSRDDVKLSLKYDEKYDFSYSNMLGLSDQLHMERLNPLSTKSGMVIFTVAEEVKDSDKPLNLIISFEKNDYIYTIK